MLPGIGFWATQLLASLLLGAFAWHAGRALHARLQLSHAAAGYWRGWWCLAVLPPLLGLLLQALSARSVAMLPHARLPLPVLEQLPMLGPAAALPPQSLLTQLQAALPLVLALLYLLGLTRALWRQWRGARALDQVLAATVPAQLQDWPGERCRTLAKTLEQRGIDIRFCALPVTAFALGGRRPRIVLPAALCQQLNDAPLQMLLQHEATHLRRRDPERAALVSALQALFWFNPWLPRLAERMQMAAELHCDGAALNDASIATDRLAYAQAYVHSLRLASSPLPAGAMAFIRPAMEQHRLRLQLMLRGEPRRRLHPLLAMVLVSLLLLSGGTAAALQWQSAMPATVSGSPSRMQSALPLPALAARGAPDLIFPVAPENITSRFGHRGGPHTNAHGGIDFGGGRGKPVVAVADATVRIATTRYPGGADFGTVVVLDHADGWQSIYAHLQQADVVNGQSIRQGTQIGRIGTTGRVTGPHVHLELLHHGERVDPEPLMR